MHVELSGPRAAGLRAWRLARSRQKCVHLRTLFPGHDNVRQQLGRSLFGGESIRSDRATAPVQIDYKAESLPGNGDICVGNQRCHHAAFLHQSSGKFSSIEFGKTIIGASFSQKNN